MSSFENADSMSAEKLLEAYRESSIYYIIRLMLAYDRIEQALPLVNFAISKFKTGKMLDYGCGASDTGLVFHAFGFGVSICDIEGGNLDFARERYNIRSIDATPIAATKTDIYPDLGKNLDFIAALEVLEHLPSPSEALIKMHASLKKGGVFAVREKSFEEISDGDHLSSAHEEWASGKYETLRNKLFKDVSGWRGRRFRGSKYMKLYEKI